MSSVLASPCRDLCASAQWLTVARAPRSDENIRMGAKEMMDGIGVEVAISLRDGPIRDAGPCLPRAG
jgi:hypothetical protein